MNQSVNQKTQKQRTLKGLLPQTQAPESRVRRLQLELMECFRHTLPRKQFRAELILGLIDLELTSRKMARTDDLAERRELNEHFERGARIMRQAMELLWEKVWRPLDHGTAQGNVSPKPSRDDSAFKIAR